MTNEHKLLYFKHSRIENADFSLLGWPLEAAEGRLSSVVNESDLIKQGHYCSSRPSAWRGGSPRAAGCLPASRTRSDPICAAGSMKTRVCFRWTTGQAERWAVRSRPVEGARYPPWRLSGGAKRGRALTDGVRGPASPSGIIPWTCGGHSGLAGPRLLRLSTIRSLLGGHCRPQHGARQLHSPPSPGVASPTRLRDLFDSSRTQDAHRPN